MLAAALVSAGPLARLRAETPSSSLVERVESTGFIQLEAEGFRALTSRQQELVYWLSRAAIAIDPIIYDQQSRFGLRQKRVLEAVVSNPKGVNADVYRRVVAYTKLFWANRGNHNEMTAQKMIPPFTLEELKAAAGPKLAAEVEALRASLFDADFEPMITAKSPRGGLDIVQASANNFYGAGVTLASLNTFAEKYRLNSRVVKRADGSLAEEVYRAGTPDGKVPAGMYAAQLRNAVGFLNKAQAVAEDAGQAEAIGKLIRFYQTGEFSDWLAYGHAWVRSNPAVDFASGFIEVYRDARGAKGTAQSFVTVTDEKVNRMMVKIAANAQYFEDRAPWAADYKKVGVKPPLAKAVEAVIEAGDFHVGTIGDNLPNEREVRESSGSKSFMFTGSTRALAAATGSKSAEEFDASPQEVEISRKYDSEASDLLVALHEVIGHGSGKLNPRLKEDAAYYLKEYASTLEEARADLVALWNVSDPKLVELGVISSPDVAKAMYLSAARVMLTQLRRIPRGDTIEEDHQRGRQLIASYIMNKTGSIAVEKRSNGKTYVVVKDFDKMRQGVGMLLAELMRIKAEGDYHAIKALIDRYGVRFDTALRDEVVARFKKLNLPTYWAGINPELKAVFGPGGRVTRVEMKYTRDYVAQHMGYGSRK
jgi:dipeptidyl-peptidase III